MHTHRKSHLWISILLLVTLLSTGLPVTRANAQATAGYWRQIAPGISYQYFRVQNPMNDVFVARMERQSPQFTIPISPTVPLTDTIPITNTIPLTTTIDSMIALGKLSTGLETIQGMANRYNGAINYYAPPADHPFGGNRNKVIVAINGSFVEPETGYPASGQVQSGWYAQRFTDRENGSGFAWTMDRTAFIGGCVYHIPERQVITDTVTKQSVYFSGINIARGSDDVIIYTPQYDAQTPSANSGAEFLVEMDRPAILIGTPRYSSGKIIKIKENKGDTFIPFDSIVISAGENRAGELLQKFQNGDTIGIMQEISTCQKWPKHDWTKTYGSVGGSFVYLQDGVVITSYTDPGATVRNPRTAIAYNDKYIFFIVVDGRQPSYSLGMTMVELGHFAKDVLGATDGINEDGGGSSTMVIKGQVVNNTYCNDNDVNGVGRPPYPQCMDIYGITANLPVMLGGMSHAQQQTQTSFETTPGVPSLPQVPEYTPLGPLAPALPLTSTTQLSTTLDSSTGITATVLNPNDPTSPDYWMRSVVNGMMMVVVEPITQSLKLQPGQAVTTTVEAQLRLGPGTNYGIYVAIPPGTRGQVISDRSNLNGVWAKSYHWWKVRFQGQEGWMREKDLQFSTP